MASYLLLGPENEGPRVGFPLTAGECVVGRGSDCQIVLTCETVSRRHARLLVSERSVEVFDLNSRNGTFVQDCRVKSSLVPVGYTVRFGNQAFVLEKLGSGAALSPRDETTGDRQQSQSSAAASVLTPAQGRVLAGLIKGKSEKAVARALKISPNTVHVHVRAIYAALGVHSRGELMAWYIGHQLEKKTER